MQEAVLAFGLAILAVGVAVFLRMRRSSRDVSYEIDAIVEEFQNNGSRLAALEQRARQLEKERRCREKLEEECREKRARDVSFGFGQKVQGHPKIELPVSPESSPAGPAFPLPLPNREEFRAAIWLAEMATQDSARATSARYLCDLFSATSYATVVDSDQLGRYDVSVTFGGLNDEELQTVATIGFRSHGFRNLTADEVRTLAAITRMEEFRREDRFL